MSNHNSQHHPHPGSRNNAARYFDETNYDVREQRVSHNVTDPEELDPLKFLKHRLQKQPKIQSTVPAEPMTDNVAVCKLIKSILNFGINSGVLRRIDKYSFEFSNRKRSSTSTINRVQYSKKRISRGPVRKKLLLETAERLFKFNSKNLVKTESKRYKKKVKLTKSEQSTQTAKEYKTQPPVFVKAKSTPRVVYSNTNWSNKRSCLRKRSITKPNNKRKSKSEKTLHNLKMLVAKVSQNNPLCEKALIEEILQENGIKMEKNLPITETQVFATNSCFNIGLTATDKSGGDIQDSSCDYNCVEVGNVETA